MGLTLFCRLLLMFVPFFQLLPTTQALTACPSKEIQYTAPDASQWLICRDSDYEVPSIQILNAVKSRDACATLCQQRSGCRKAVYDKTNLICHIKGDPTKPTWSSNTNFDSIRYMTKPQEGTPLSSCPSGDQNITAPSGRGFASCPNGDLNGPATQVIGRVTSTFSCVVACDGAPGCTKAVYSQKDQICFLKSKDAPWVYATGMQAIRLVSGTSSYTGNRGKWAPAVNFPLVPVGAFIIPEQPVSKRILAFSSWGTFEFSGPTGITQFADYNWDTGAISQRTVTNTKHDMFCPGMSYLANGTMVVNGGQNAEAVSFYNYKTNTFTRAADMKLPRGYQSSTTLSDGRVFTIGGSFSGGIGGKTGEVYDPVNNAWTLLKGCDVAPMLTTYDAEGPWRTDNHAWLFGWKNGYVFQAGPSRTMHWYGTVNGGSVGPAGTRDAANDAMCGVNVMFDAVAGKIFSAGGSQSYTNSEAFIRAHQITIDAPLQPAQVENLPDMNFQRGFANAVVLPNSQVLITGGQATSLVFTDIESVLAAELWDPVTKNFTVLASAKIPRNYHSVSLLLADGRVFTGGGGMCPVGQGESTAFCDKTISHFDGEIFSPPYLFNDDGSVAPRPVISKLSSNTDASGYQVRPGGKLTVDMNDASGTTFSLVRLGSATHSINTDQRRVPLTGVVASGQRYVITLPSDAGVVIPGYYYLFAMNKAGTPAIARTVQISS